MEIRETDNFCIFAPLSSKLNNYECARLFKEIKAETRSIAIDLQYVQDCSFNFIEGLKEICTQKEIGIFNIPTEIFTLFNIMNLDRDAHLYVSQNDFEDNKRQLINRKFSII